MLFHTPSLVTSRWKPADASEIKALWIIFSQRLFILYPLPPQRPSYLAAVAFSVAALTSALKKAMDVSTSQ